MRAQLRPEIDKSIEEVSAQTISLPRACVRELLWQRAAYRIWPYNKINPKIFGKKKYMKFIAGSPVEWIRRKVIAKMYHDELVGVYSALSAHLPETAIRSLDIGCGIAGIDIFLHRHYGSQQTEFWLLDKDETSPLSGKHYSGFNADTAGYNSLELSRLMLEMNDVPKDRIHTVNIHDDIFPDGPFDVILSLLSWGFHYPVSFYLPLVLDKLSADGVLALDVRRNTGDLEVLSESFEETKIIMRGEKHDFVVARRAKKKWLSHPGDVVA
jgi:hypothetical protein